MFRDRNVHLNEDQEWIMNNGWIESGWFKGPSLPKSLTDILVKARDGKDDVHHVSKWPSYQGHWKKMPIKLDGSYTGLEIKDFWVGVRNLKLIILKKYYTEIYRLLTSKSRSPPTNLGVWDSRTPLNFNPWSYNMNIWFISAHYACNKTVLI
jgi:hypothetical protein